MKKFFSLSSLFLYLISIIAFFLIGALLAGVLGLAEGQGLAGGAIILMYGVFGSVIALIMAIFLVYKCSYKVVVWANSLLTCIAIVLVLYTILMNQNRNDDPEFNPPSQQNTTAPINSISF